MEKTSKTNIPKKGIRLRVLNIGMIILACLLSVFLIYAVLRTTDSYGAMRQATEEYITCQTYAADLQAGSDYLTEQVRLFAVTGDTLYVDKYFYEVHVTRRRENALNNMERFLAGSDTYRYLSDAMAVSEELMGRECYSMRLMIEALGLPVDDFPEELRAVTLKGVDLEMSSSKQRSIATGMVFDDTYLDYKTRISDNVNLCVDTLISETRSQQLSSSARLLDLLRQQNILIGILLVIVFAVVFLTSYLIIHPLRRNIAYIRNQEKLPMTGSYELQILAETYNKMFEQNRKDQDRLSFEATHDVLTGLYNRSVFEKMRETCDESTIAMILVDVDKFKGINDTYGHETGDRVLKKVASLLQAAFRSEDYVCRIGGDEFAILMVHAGSDLRELVRNKIANVNQKLSAEEADLPPVTLSVGVAFGDRQNPSDDIFNDADAALYRVKNNGHNGCDFY